MDAAKVFTARRDDAWLEQPNSSAPTEKNYFRILRAKLHLT